ncbi:hypothetical protein X975_09201, partial [Stegodyphus mimosarum]
MNIDPIIHIFICVTYYSLNSSYREAIKYVSSVTAFCSLIVPISS